MYPFLSPALHQGGTAAILEYLYFLHSLCYYHVRSLEKMNTVFEYGNSWMVFKSIDRIMEQDIDDWRWTKKLKA